MTGLKSSSRQNHWRSWWAPYLRLPYGSRHGSRREVSCLILSSNAKKLESRGVVVLLAGLNSAKPRDRRLVDLGLVHPDVTRRWFVDLDHALEWVELELLKKKWPQLAAEPSVELSQTQLARGLSKAELEILTSRADYIEAAAGTVLFRKGDAGSAVYLVRHGLVEVRIDADLADRNRRLAVFGPGAVFGEVAMLTDGQRSADAICIKPSALYRLDGHAIRALQHGAPVVYAKLISNMSVHLAARLIAATEIVQGYR